MEESNSSPRRSPLSRPRTYTIVRPWDEVVSGFLSSIPVDDAHRRNVIDDVIQDTDKRNGEAQIIARSYINLASVPKPLLLALRKLFRGLNTETKTTTGDPEPDEQPDVSLPGEDRLEALAHMHVTVNYGTQTLTSITQNETGKNRVLGTDTLCIEPSADEPDTKTVVTTSLELDFGRAQGIVTDLLSAPLLGFVNQYKDSMVAQWS